MRNISVKLFKIWTSGSGEDAAVCAILEETRHEEQFCEVILNLNQCLNQQEMSFKDIS